LRPLPPQFFLRRHFDITLGLYLLTAQEQEEAKSRQIEDLIKSYKGASALLPQRQYGKPVNPEKFGITLRSIIEKIIPN